MTGLVFPVPYEDSKSEVLLEVESQRRELTLLFVLICSCLVCTPGIGLVPKLLATLIPGNKHVDAGEVGLLNVSSCKMSPILDSIVKAKFPRTREYASRIEFPTSYIEFDKRSPKLVPFNL